MKTNFSFQILFLLVSVCPTLCLAQAYQTGEKRFPKAAVVNVKEVYQAKGDGKHDDTDAIQRAISENIGKDRTLYFSDGIYLVTQPLRWVHIRGGDSLWRARLTIQGQSQANTVIRLANNILTNPETPVPFIATGSDPLNDPATKTRRESKDGGGNNAFNNLFYDLTINTGKGNTGAVAIDFVGTNMAGLRNVTIKSEDGLGVAGLRLKREGAGPCLFKNLHIAGFDFGIDVYGSQYSQTYEYLTLNNQRKAAIRNNGNVLTLRKVRSENGVTVILNVNRNDRRNPKNSGNFGMITLIDSYFIGKGNAQFVNAIDNEEGLNGRKGAVYTHNVIIQGYGNAVKNRNRLVKKIEKADFVSDPPLGNKAEPEDDNFALPIREAPDFHENNTDKWANVNDFGASAEDSDGDDTQGIQAAIDSGAEIIFFPRGKYRYVVNKTIVVRRNVHQLIGMQSGIDVGGSFFKDTTQLKALFRFEPGKQDTVYFERFNLSNQSKKNFDGGIFIEHASPQTLVLKDLNNDVYAKGRFFYRNAPKAGKLFIENVASITPWSFLHAQHVWARQFNAESHFVPVGEPIISQNQGSLWILGLKTEGPRTVISSTNGTVELLGGFLYPVKEIKNKNLPAFVSQNSSLKLTYVTNAFDQTADYTLMIKEVNGANTNYIYKDRLENRGMGSMLPLYIIESPQKRKQ